MQNYPKWIFHKTLPAKIVETKEEHDAQGPEWKETPAAFSEEQTQASEEPKADKAEGEQGAAPIKEADFTKMKVADLRAYLIEKGVAADEVEGLKKDELIAKIGSL